MDQNPITYEELSSRGLHLNCAPYLMERILESLRAELGRTKAAEAILEGKTDSLHPAEVIAGEQWIEEWHAATVAQSEAAD